MDGRQVHVRALRCCQETLVHGRNTQEEGARQATLRRQDHGRIELGEHGDCRAQTQACQEADCEAEGVEEGQDAVEHLGTLVEDGNPRDRFFDVGHEVGVRERGGLWHAGCAARVDEEGDVVHGGWATALPRGGRAHGSCPGACPAGAWT